MNNQNEKDDTERLFDLCTNLLKGPIDELAKKNNISPSDVVAILTIAIGRITGNMGYRHMNKDQYWDAIIKNGKALYDLGFDSERAHEN